jgi:hypothetical protein
MMDAFVIYCMLYVIESRSSCSIFNTRMSNIEKTISVHKDRTEGFYDGVSFRGKVYDL